MAGRGETWSRQPGVGLRSRRPGDALFVFLPVAFFSIPVLFVVFLSTSAFPVTTVVAFLSAGTGTARDADAQ